jgi:penicillin amidase
MRIVRRLLGVILVVVVVVAITVTGLLAWITLRAQPPSSGTIRIAGLQASVTVGRDADGIVSITADTPHDLFVAQGYVHATERLWQMEVWRHIGAGRLSELFGTSQVDTDRFIRTLGWRQAAQRDLDALSPEVQDILQWYADGVNAYIDAQQGSLGLPFVVVGMQSGLGGGLGGYTPEPWTPLDSATWQKVQAWNLGGNLTSELMRLVLDARLGDPSRTDELTPPYPSWAPIIAPTSLLAGTTGVAGSSSVTGSAATDATRPGILTADATPADPFLASTLSAAQLDGLRSLAATARAIPTLAGLDQGDGLLGARGRGSNDWVVAPSKSATGGALLANDPHLGISNPSVWYMNGLHCRAVGPDCPFDVTGVSFPGAPLVILGHDARVAWGATNTGPDVEDLVMERTDPNDPARYLWGDTSLPFETRTETIQVAGGEPITMTVRSTIHGPILNDVEDRLADLPDLYALRWTATAEPDRTLEAFLGLDLATDWSSFRDALSVYGSPIQNFVYADVDGHIGYQMPGYVPIRQAQGDRGARPVPGWDAQHEWVGRIAYDDLPRLYDPPTGVIVTANNAVVDADYPFFISDEWDPGDRASRILSRLDEAVAKGGVTVEDLSSIQMDATVLRVDRIRPVLDGAQPTTDDGRLLLDRIQGWDGRCDDIASTGCLAWMAFEYRLERGIFDDDLGLDIARDYVGVEPSWTLLSRLATQPEASWWDDSSTPQVERAPDIVAAALDKAGAELRTAYGDPSGWTWGRAHTATFREPTLGESGIGPLEWYFDQGPFAVGGEAGSPDATSWRAGAGYPDPDTPDAPDASIAQVFAVTNLPSYRLAIDMSDLDGARIVTTTGNGGHPFGPHDGDLTDDWVAGRTVPLPFTGGAIQASTVQTLTLEPDGGG